MQWLLTLLLLASPEIATSSEPLDHIKVEDLCGAIAIELADAVRDNLITRDQAIGILLRCEQYHQPQPYETDTNLATSGGSVLRNQSRTSNVL